MEFDIDGRPKKKGRKLADIEIDEISLVGRAANKKSFIILKKEKGMEFLKKFLDEDRLVLAEKIPDTAMQVLRDSLETLEKYLDVFPEDIAEKIKALAQLVVDLGAGAGEDYGHYPEEKPADEKGNGKKVKKKISGLIWPSFFAPGDTIAKGALGIGKVYNPNPFNVEEDPEEEEEDEEEKKFQKGGQIISHKRPQSQRIQTQEDEEEKINKSEGPLWPSLTGGGE